MGQDLGCCRFRQVRLASQKGRHDDRRPALCFHTSIRHFSSIQASFCYNITITVYAVGHTASSQETIAARCCSLAKRRDRNLLTIGDDAVERLRECLRGCLRERLRDNSLATRPKIRQPRLFWKGIDAIRSSILPMPPVAAVAAELEALVRTSRVSTMWRRHDRWWGWMFHGLCLLWLSSPL